MFRQTLCDNQLVGVGTESGSLARSGPRETTRDFTAGFLLGLMRPRCFFPAGHPRGTRGPPAMHRAVRQFFSAGNPRTTCIICIFLVHPVAVWKRDAAMTMLASGRATLAPSRFLPRPAPFGHCFILPRSPLLAHARLRRADHALTSLLAPTNLTPRRNSGTKRQRRWRALSELRRISGARGFRFWRFIRWSFEQQQLN